MGGEGRSLFDDVGKGDRVLLVVKGDRYLTNLNPMQK
jgi:hypothetical protein